MKKTTRILTTFILIVSLLVASNAAATDAIGALREMMSLDYPVMTIAEFHQSIQDIADSQRMSVFQVIADSYDTFSVDDENGDFVAIVIEDAELGAFLQSTLKYSAQDILGEPGYLESVAYITTDNYSAKAMLEQKQQMTAMEYNAYLDGMIDEISIHAHLFFLVEYEIPDPTAITVAQRDEKLNAVRSDMEAFIVSMSEEEIVASDIESKLTAHLDELMQKYSDGNMSVLCTIQEIEKSCID